MLQNEMSRVDNSHAADNLDHRSNPSVRKAKDYVSGTMVHQISQCFDADKVLTLYYPFYECIILLLMRFVNSFNFVWSQLLEIYALY